MRQVMKSLSVWCVAVAAVAAAAGAVRAQQPAAAGATPPKPETLKEAVAQVDGVTNRVLDGLWTHVDHYWHDGDYNRIVSLSRMCVEIDPSFNEAYAAASYLLWSQGDVPAADWFLQYGIGRTNYKGGLYFELGRHLYTTKRYGDAAKYLEKAVAQPNPTPIWYATLGHSYRQLKRYDDAVRVWQIVVDKYPSFAAGPTNLARAKQLQKQAKS
jgi:tetratricopeptide (TPR) repeat protein